MRDDEIGRLYEALVAWKREKKRERRVAAGCVATLVGLGVAVVWAACALACERREECRERRMMELEHAERVWMDGGAR